ncbi:IQ domain-containing protein/DUF4005 domain-containing protein [Cephalotus follicularis]|uniref:IQ domain-containing protein/DUF4005 domain-containing protein n=1 Tax=Cephalotus follicularis TaxID=3775 RepID=A0A1Q3C6L2_CEPFO|nr:IQ domain-containing protein/DUF4005 domain-containing protein [Cephalotus follicularis]
MGKTRRWLKGLLGMKKEKDKDQLDNLSESSVFSEKRKEKKRWSFGRSWRESQVPSQIPVNVVSNFPASDASWLCSYIVDNEEEQNKHAIAVASATAAAADAAVAAAHAAVAVVRLTSNGRGNFVDGRAKLAATKIQCVFRGYLARRALRALKGLVKIQALVRGFLVRKRTTATLRSMEALLRAQVAARSRRLRRSLNKENRYQPEIRPRKSIEKFDDARSEYHSKRCSPSIEMTAFDESPKIVEMDTFRPKSISRRMNAVLSEFDDDVSYPAMPPPYPCPNPTRISIPHCYNFQDNEWCFTQDECKCPTTQITPRFASSFLSNAPVTPAKSVCGDSYYRPCLNHPNYMSNTQSFKAKLRSHSAPKQRPEPGLKKRLSLDEILAARNSISSVSMQRTNFQDEE